MVFKLLPLTVTGVVKATPAEKLAGAVKREVALTLSTLLLFDPMLTLPRAVNVPFTTTAVPNKAVPFTVTVLLLLVPSTTLPLAVS